MRVNRRTLFASTLGAAASAGCAAAWTGTQAAAVAIDPLNRPESGHIRAAFLVDRNTNIIDLGGPWETLGAGGNDAQHFELYTVSPTQDAVSLGGIAARSHYTLENAPPPHVIVMGAQTGGVDVAETTAAKVDWLRRMAPNADLVMSVCTGAFLLARTGLIDGRLATTHHDYYDNFEQQFPNVRLVRNRRFVDNGKFVSGGGLTSGIDAALHIVARYFGVADAEAGAAYLEHYSDGWRTGVREA